MQDGIVVVPAAPGWFVKYQQKDVGCVVELLREEAVLPPSPLVDTADASKFLGIPESWLATRARNGEAPCRRLGKYVRFDLVELRAWIDATTASGALGHLHCGDSPPNPGRVRAAPRPHVRAVLRGI